MATQLQESINRAPSKPVSQFSNFRESLQYGFGNSYRFGEIGVHYVADAVKSENGKLINSHDLRSYTLPKPLMQNFWMRKTYGFVPLSAILPLNYEKYSNIPNRGEDINPDLVGTTVLGFIGNLQAFLQLLYNRAVSDFEDGYFSNVLRFVLFYDMMLSRGGLAKSLGITFANTNSTPDNDVDSFFSRISEVAVNNYAFKLTIRGKSWYVGKSSPEVGIGHISLREAISKMRDDFSFFISDVSDVDALNPSDFETSAFDFVSSDSAPVNLERFFAYQLFCAHFFSNDHVDSIFTAELYRQNLRALLSAIIPSYVDSTFTWNGVRYRYDTCSAFMMQQVFNEYIDVTPISDSSDVDEDTVGNVLDYFRLIFGFNRSLRFGDYFTGSRTLPLAPGDVTVEVNGTSFSVVESIKKSWYARLLAQIQRVGRRTSAQSKALYPDVNTVQDWHEPIWLGETTSSVWSEEVDNTGEDQFNEDMPISTSAVLRSKQDAMAFEIRVPDREGTIIGFTWFDIPRYYAHATDRSFFAISRFDKFNPYLQFNGDQPIYRKELTSDSHTLGDEYFGYTGRYMEYKQRYNIAAGAFADDTVPGLLFIADDGKDYVDVENLSSDYIRSYPSELDKFYISLSGWSLGHYFHFLVINQNDYDGNKPMAYNPTLD